MLSLDDFTGFTFGFRLYVWHPDGYREPGKPAPAGGKNCLFRTFCPHHYFYQKTFCFFFGSAHINIGTIGFTLAVNS